MNIQEILESQNWKFAKTMPETPHWYSVRDTWDSDFEFEKACQFILDHGVIMRWNLYRKPYLDINEWRYWIMTKNVKKTILINREEIKISKAVPE